MLQHISRFPLFFDKQAVELLMLVHSESFNSDFFRFKFVPETIPQDGLEIRFGHGPWTDVRGAELAFPVGWTGYHPLRVLRGIVRLQGKGVDPEENCGIPNLGRESLSKRYLGVHRSFQLMIHTLVAANLLLHHASFFCAGVLNVNSSLQSQYESLKVVQ